MLANLCTRLVRMITIYKLYFRLATNVMNIQQRQHLQYFECRLMFVREVTDSENVPIYTDSASTYFTMGSMYISMAMHIYVLLSLQRISQFFHFEVI